MSKKKKEYFGDKPFRPFIKELDELEKELIDDINKIRVIVRKKKK